MAGFISGNAVLGAGSVGTTQLANDAVTLAKMASGTANQNIAYDGSGNPVDVAASAGGFTLGTEQSTTTGSVKTFTGIPAGVDMIVIMFYIVSINAGGDITVEIGDAEGIETTGYNGIGMRVYSGAVAVEATWTTAFAVADGITHSNNTMSGSITLSRQNGNTWACTSLLGDAVQQACFTSGSIKTLSAELTQLTVSTTASYDAGAINIMYQ